eukprot:3163813-Rhodomonas_salina.4
MEMTGWIRRIVVGSSSFTAFPPALTSRTLKGPKYFGVNLDGNVSSKSVVLSKAYKNVVLDVASPQAQCFSLPDLNLQDAIVHCADQRDQSLHKD